MKKISLHRFLFVIVAVLIGRQFFLYATNDTANNNNSSSAHEDEPQSLDHDHEKKEEPPKLVVANLTAGTTPITDCAKSNHQRLMDKFQVQLEARWPLTIDKNMWNPLRGSKIRIPVYNIHPNATNTTTHTTNNTASTTTTTTTRHYHLWARLMTDTLLLPTTFIYYHYPKPPSSNPTLFAELEFVVWEPADYILEIELRYIYGGDVKVATNRNLFQQSRRNFSRIYSNFSKFYASMEPHKSLRQNSPNVDAGVFAHYRRPDVNQEVPVQFMARDDDLKTWSTYDKAKIPPYESWRPYREKWVKQHCMDIPGSPFTLAVDWNWKQNDDPDTTTVSNNNNTTTTTPIFHTTVAAASSTTPSTSTRFCTAADTQRPGYWTVVDSKTFRDRPFLLIEPSYYHLWSREHVQRQRPNLRYVTPGCQWEFPNATRLLQCLEPYGFRVNLVGSSLIRLLHAALESYFQHLGISNKIAFGKRYKKRGINGTTEGKLGVAGFDMDEGGVFIDDFNLIHHIGWGAEGSSNGYNLNNKETSPNRLAHELERHAEEFSAMDNNDNRTTSNNNSTSTNDTSQHPKKKTRFFYYVTHYLNDYRCKQGFEPFVSYYSAVTAASLQQHAGYEIFDTNRLFRALVEANTDGLHYHADVVSMISIMLLNAMCDDTVG